jgi:hypothetical protein
MFLLIICDSTAYASDPAGGLNKNNTKELEVSTSKSFNMNIIQGVSWKTCSEWCMDEGGCLKGRWWDIKEKRKTLRQQLQGPSDLQGTY